MKIFGIGLHKTGTSSLGRALKELGYSVCGCRTELAEPLLEGNLEPVFRLVDQYEAFQDHPWPLLYEELDERYPDSKFILTVRHEDRWLKSVLNHFGDRHSAMRRWIYGKGVPRGNEHLYLDKFKTHNRAVRAYFQNKPDKFLELSFEQGDGWEKLCTFLDKPFPERPFPHENRGRYSPAWNILSRVKQWIAG